MNFLETWRAVHEKASTAALTISRNFIIYRATIPHESGIELSVTGQDSLARMAREEDAGGGETISIRINSCRGLRGSRWLPPETAKAISDWVTSRSGELKIIDLQAIGLCPISTSITPLL
jgi:hypothetical protein